MTTPARILIADDHDMVRAGFRSLLQAHTDEFDVVGEAADGQAALEQVRTLQPDVVLLDLKMPQVNGTEALQSIKRRLPTIKVLILTQYDNEEYVRAAFAAGADGYLLKYDHHDWLFKALRSILAGDVFVSPRISKGVISGFLASGQQAPSPDSVWELLSARERVILKLIAEGKKSREIAEQLTLSIRTIEDYRANLRKKLHLKSGSELIAYAINQGLVETTASRR